MRELAEKYYQLLIRAASGLQSPFLLAIRLYGGWQFMQTGWGELSDIHKVVASLPKLGIPAPALNAWFVSGLTISPASEKRPKDQERKSRQRPGLYGKGQAASGRN
jgi:hypothetical protein